MPDLSAAVDRQLLDVNGLMKEPVSGEALHLGDAVERNLIIEVLVSAEEVDRVTRVSETFRLRVDSVRDTQTDCWLSLDDAVDSGIVVPALGEYVDRRRGIHMPLIDAVRDGLIQGRLLDVERKKEEVTRTGNEASARMVDGGFGSVRSLRAATSAVTSSDGMPLSVNVRGIIDPRTGAELTVREAVDAGMFDATTGEFIYVTTGERVSLERALALNLVVADGDDQVDEMVIPQTYSIGAVHDPVTGELISPGDAEARGLLDMARGMYILPEPEEAITLAEALERGLIRAEALEGGRDVMMTGRASTIERSRMVFTIKRVKDLSTGEMIGPDEAVKRGILDTAEELYIDSRTGKTMLLHEAYKAGLIEAAETSVPDQSSVDGTVSRRYMIGDYDTLGPGPAAVVHDAQSYRIKSVIDPRTGEEIPIADAVRHKIVDKASKTYWNMRTDETMPIDEAIRLSLIHI